MSVTEGFESGFYVYKDIGELTVPNGWTPTWMQGSQAGTLVRPEYKPAGSAQVRSGKGAVACHSTSATLDAALYKQFDVGESAVITASVWMLKTENALGGGQRLGIDPAGGIDHTAESVIWSNWYSQYESDYEVNKWRERVIDCTARGRQITVFLQSKVDYKANSFNTHFDDLRLNISEVPSTGTDYNLIRRIVREELLAMLRELGHRLLE